MSALLQQAAMASGPADRSALEQRAGQIRVIALAHRQSQREHDLEVVDVAAYLDRLCEHLRIGSRAPRLIAVAPPGLLLPIDRASPMGLLLAQIFALIDPENADETVRITLSRDGGKRLAVEVTSTGKPRAGASTPDDPDLAFVATLAHRLGFDLEALDAPRAGFLLTFTAAQAAR